VKAVLLVRSPVKHSKPVTALFALFFHFHSPACLFRSPDPRLTARFSFLIHWTEIRGKISRSLVVAGFPFHSPASLSFMIQIHGLIRMGGIPPPMAGSEGHCTVRFSARSLGASSFPFTTRVYFPYPPSTSLSVGRWWCEGQEERGRALD
jgi:hypothetical protein